jgi:catechol 2,3-dioxygenase-like lactoylglutathione lyase family enzyme
MSGYSVEAGGENLAICASHDAPVQKWEEGDTGFAIHVEGMDTELRGKEMIKDVPLTGVFVNDQEAALDFYTNTLGLEKVQDEPYGEGGARWITVSPAGLQDQDRPEEGRTRLREGPGRPLRRGADPDAGHQRRTRSLRAAAGAGRTLPRRTLPLPVGHRGALVGPGRQSNPPAAGVGRTVAASDRRPVVKPRSGYYKTGREQPE